MIQKTRVALVLAMISAMAIFMPAAMAATTADSTDKKVETAAPKAEVAQTAPAIVVTKPRYEFSPVLEGEHVTRTFTVANQGTADLEIIRVRTG